MTEICGLLEGAELSNKMSANNIMSKAKGVLIKVEAEMVDDMADILGAIEPASEEDKKGLVKPKYIMTELEELEFQERKAELVKKRVTVAKLTERRIQLFEGQNGLKFFPMNVRMRTLWEECLKDLVALGGLAFSYYKTALESYYVDIMEMRRAMVNPQFTPDITMAESTLLSSKGMANDIEYFKTTVLDNWILGRISENERNLKVSDDWIHTLVHERTVAKTVRPLPKFLFRYVTNGAKRLAEVINDDALTFKYMDVPQRVFIPGLAKPVAQNPGKGEIQLRFRVITGETKQIKVWNTVKYVLEGRMSLMDLVDLYGKVGFCDLTRDTLRVIVADVLKDPTTADNLAWKKYEQVADVSKDAEFAPSEGEEPITNLVEFLESASTDQKLRLVWRMERKNLLILIGKGKIQVPSKLVINDLASPKLKVLCEIFGLKTTDRTGKDNRMVMLAGLNKKEASVMAGLVKWMGRMIKSVEWRLEEESFVKDSILGKLITVPESKDRYDVKKQVKVSGDLYTVPIDASVPFPYTREGFGKLKDTLSVFPVYRRWLLRYYLETYLFYCSHQGSVQAALQGEITTARSRLETLMTELITTANTPSTGNEQNDLMFSDITVQYLETYKKGYEGLRGGYVTAKSSANREGKDEARLNNQIDGVSAVIRFLEESIKYKKVDSPVLEQLNKEPNIIPVWTFFDPDVYGAYWTYLEGAFGRISKSDEEKVKFLTNLPDGGAIWFQRYGGYYDRYMLLNDTPKTRALTGLLTRTTMPPRTIGDLIKERNVVEDKKKEVQMLIQEIRSYFKTPRVYMRNTVLRTDIKEEEIPDEVTWEDSIERNPGELDTEYAARVTKTKAIVNIRRLQQLVGVDDYTGEFPMDKYPKVRAYYNTYRDQMNRLRAKYPEIAISDFLPKPDPATVREKMVDCDAMLDFDPKNPQKMVIRARIYPNAPPLAEVEELIVEPETVREELPLLVRYVNILKQRDAINAQILALNDTYRQLLSDPYLNLDASERAVIQEKEAIAHRYMDTIKNYTSIYQASNAPTEVLEEGVSDVIKSLVGEVDKKVLNNEMLFLAPNVLGADNVSGQIIQFAKKIMSKQEDMSDMIHDYLHKQMRWGAAVRLPKLAFIPVWEKLGDFTARVEWYEFIMNTNRNFFGILKGMINPLVDEDGKVITNESVVEKVYALLGADMGLHRRDAILSARDTKYYLVWLINTDVEIVDVDGNPVQHIADLAKRIEQQRGAITGVITDAQGVQREQKSPAVLGVYDVCSISWVDLHVEYYHAILEYTRSMGWEKADMLAFMGNIIKEVDQLRAELPAFEQVLSYENINAQLTALDEEMSGVSLGKLPELNNKVIQSVSGVDENGNQMSGFRVSNKEFIVRGMYGVESQESLLSRAKDVAVRLAGEMNVTGVDYGKNIQPLRTRDKQELHYVSEEGYDFGRLGYIVYSPKDAVTGKSKIHVVMVRTYCPSYEGAWVLAVSYCKRYHPEKQLALGVAYKPVVNMGEYIQNNNQAMFERHHSAVLRMIKDSKRKAHRKEQKIKKRKPGKGGIEITDAALIALQEDYNVASTMDIGRMRDMFAAAGIVGYENATKDQMMEALGLKAPELRMGDNKRLKEIEILKQAHENILKYRSGEAVGKKLQFSILNALKGGYLVKIMTGRHKDEVVRITVVEGDSIAVDGMRDRFGVNDIMLGGVMTRDAVTKLNLLGCYENEYKDAAAQAADEPITDARYMRYDLVNQYKDMVSRLSEGARNEYDKAILMDKLVGYVGKQTIIGEDGKEEVVGVELLGIGVIVEVHTGGVMLKMLEETFAGGDMAPPRMHDVYLELVNQGIITDALGAIMANGIDTLKFVSAEIDIKDRIAILTNRMNTGYYTLSKGMQRQLLLTVWAEKDIMQAVFKYMMNLENTGHPIAQQLMQAVRAGLRPGIQDAAERQAAVVQAWNANTVILDFLMDENVAEEDLNAAEQIYRVNILNETVAGQACAGQCPAAQWNVPGACSCYGSKTIQGEVSMIWNRAGVRDIVRRYIVERNWQESDRIVISNDMGLMYVYEDGLVKNDLPIAGMWDKVRANEAAELARLEERLVEIKRAKIRVYTAMDDIMDEKRVQWRNKYGIKGENRFTVAFHTYDVVNDTMRALTGSLSMTPYDKAYYMSKIFEPGVKMMDPIDLGIMIRDRLKGINEQTLSLMDEKLNGLLEESGNGMVFVKWSDLDMNAFTQMDLLDLNKYNIYEGRIVYQHGVGFEVMTGEGANNQEIHTDDGIVNMVTGEWVGQVIDTEHVSGEDIKAGVFATRVVSSIFDSEWMEDKAIGMGNVLDNLIKRVQNKTKKEEALSKGEMGWVDKWMKKVGIAYTAKTSPLQKLMAMRQYKLMVMDPAQPRYCLRGMMGVFEKYMNVESPFYNYRMISGLAANQKHTGEDNKSKPKIQEHEWYEYPVFVEILRTMRKIKSDMVKYMVVLPRLETGVTVAGTTYNVDLMALLQEPEFVEKIPAKAEMVIQLLFTEPMMDYVTEQQRKVHALIVMYEAIIAGNTQRAAKFKNQKLVAWIKADTSKAARLNQLKMYLSALHIAVNVENTYVGISSRMRELFIYFAISGMSAKTLSSFPESSFVRLMALDIVVSAGGMDRKEMSGRTILALLCASMVNICRVNNDGYVLEKRNRPVKERILADENTELPKNMYKVSRNFTVTRRSADEYLRKQVTAKSKELEVKTDELDTIETLTGQIEEIEGKLATAGGEIKDKRGRVTSNERAVLEAEIQVLRKKIDMLTWAQKEEKIRERASQKYKERSLAVDYTGNIYDTWDISGLTWDYIMPSASPNKVLNPFISNRSECDNMLVDCVVLMDSLNRFVNKITEKTAIEKINLVSMSKQVQFTRPRVITQFHRLVEMIKEAMIQMMNAERSTQNLLHMGEHLFNGLSPYGDWGMLESDEKKKWAYEELMRFLKSEFIEVNLGASTDGELMNKRVLYDTYLNNLLSGLDTGVDKKTPAEMNTILQERVSLMLRGGLTDEIIHQINVVVQHYALSNEIDMSTLLERNYGELNVATTIDILRTGQAADMPDETEVLATKFAGAVKDLMSEAEQMYEVYYVKAMPQETRDELLNVLRNGNQREIRQAFRQIFVPMVQFPVGQTPEQLQLVFDEWSQVAEAIRVDLQKTGRMAPPPAATMRDYQKLKKYYASPLMTRLEELDMEIKVRMGVIKESIGKLLQVVVNRVRDHHLSERGAYIRKMANIYDREMRAKLMAIARQMGQPMNEASYAAQIKSYREKITASADSRYMYANATTLEKMRYTLDDMQRVRTAADIYSLIDRVFFPITMNEKLEFVLNIMQRVVLDLSNVKLEIDMYETQFQRMLNWIVSHPEAAVNPVSVVDPTGVLESRYKAMFVNKYNLPVLEGILREIYGDNGYPAPVVVGMDKCRQLYHQIITNRTHMMKFADIYDTQTSRLYKLPGGSYMVNDELEVIRQQLIKALQLSQQRRISMSDAYHAYVLDKVPNKERVAADAELNLLVAAAKAGDVDSQSILRAVQEKGRAMINKRDEDMKGYIEAIRNSGYNVNSWATVCREYLGLTQLEILPGEIASLINRGEILFRSTGCFVFMKLSELRKIGYLLEDSIGDTDGRMLGNFMRNAEFLQSGMSAVGDVLTPEMENTINAEVEKYKSKFKGANGKLVEAAEEVERKVAAYKSELEKQMAATVNKGREKAYYSEIKQAKEWSKALTSGSGGEYPDEERDNEAEAIYKESARAAKAKKAREIEDYEAVRRGRQTE